MIDTPSLHMEWIEAPWDSVIFGFPVLQITLMKIRGSQSANDFEIFEKARDQVGAGLVSCRIPHESLKESMLLEKSGFRFIEMVYKPEMDGLKSRSIYETPSLSVRMADERDLSELKEIAGSAFFNDRYHIDPRVDSKLGDERFRRWVQSSLTHPRQRLYVLCDGECRIGFFVTELLDDGTCYWHLTAMAPAFQNKGYGRLSWLAMLNQAKGAGAERVHTCISARDHRTINLYASLGFYFPPPLMTFHWVR